MSYKKRAICSALKFIFFILRGISWQLYLQENASHIKDDQLLFSALWLFLLCFSFLTVLCVS